MANPVSAQPGKPMSQALDASRIKKRYRAEARFRWYGLAAIGFACAFLVLLLSDILLKGLPAFEANTVTLDVALDDSKIDADAINKGNFNSIVNSAIRAQFPGVKSRSDRRALPKLLSFDAADKVRREIIANPALIGTTQRLDLKLSDEADLFLQGMSTDEAALPVSGSLSVEEVGKDFRLTSSGDDFTGVLARVKQQLETRRARLSLDASKLERVRDRLAAETPVAEAAVAEAGTAATDTHPAKRRLAKLRADTSSVAAALERLKAQTDKLSASIENPSGAEILTSALPSYFVWLPERGVVKIAEVGSNYITGQAYMPVAATDAVAAGNWSLVEYSQPEADRRINDKEIIWLTSLRDAGMVNSGFNWPFFQRGDSREAEVAGVLGGMIGSALTLLVTLILSLPIGVAAAIYLEEFAPRNRITRLIEVNINNLAAVPSIVFGLLGLAVFLNFFGLPRSSAMVGGMVLALMTLPTIIIASRAALRAVPPSIREGALGVGASHQQAVFHHVLPLAMPGILTGTIIGMAQALGETAPLLMIGMVAFIVDVPTGFSDAATVLPVQIFLWSDLPEAAFQAKTAGAIMVLLGFLFLMNALAVFLRRQFERRW
ncbi:phosphate ABC transporter permease PstA [Anderseniella sp. Alg231-50]|uniref:phosphate ABC transporter permease PstA n=1 Tax=Anderseniella sp. Alg231-50 TaxID=1922226 RepID=UPI00307C19F3